MTCLEKSTPPSAVCRKGIWQISTPLCLFHISQCQPVHLPILCLQGHMDVQLLSKKEQSQPGKNTTAIFIWYRTVRRIPSTVLASTGEGRPPDFSLRLASSGQMAIGPGSGQADLMGRTFVQFVGLYYYGYLSEQIRRTKQSPGVETGEPSHDTKDTLRKETFILAGEHSCLSDTAVVRCVELAV